MTPTTEQLKDLLAKVTPGEWRVDHSYQWPSKVRADPPFNDRWICDASVMPSAKDQSHTLHNAHLIALAPTLAAEVVRLRARVEELEDYISACEEHAMEDDAGPDW